MGQGIETTNTVDPYFIFYAKTNNCAGSSAFVNHSQNILDICGRNNKGLELLWHKLLEKIEELTLYTIEQEKKLERLEKVEKDSEVLKKENKELKETLSALVKRIETIETNRKDEK